MEAVPPIDRPNREGGFYERGATMYANIVRLMNVTPTTAYILKITKITTYQQKKHLNKRN